MLDNWLIQLSSSCLNNHFYAQVFLVQNFTLNVTDVILTCATTTCKNTTGPPWRPADVGEEFSLVAQTKYPGSVTAIQERHLDAAVQFFPLTLIHSDSRWRSLAWLGICDCCQQELWMGRRAETRAHTHTHTHTLNELRVYCTDVLVRTAGFRLHSNKGTHPHTPHLLTHT